MGEVKPRPRLVPRAACRGAHRPRVPRHRVRPGRSSTVGATFDEATKEDRMSARVEVQAPSAQKPWAAPWVAALLALLLATGTLAWLLSRSSDRATTTLRKPAVSSVTQDESRAYG